MNRKLYVVATVGKPEKAGGAIPDPEAQDFITTSRVGVDFATMDVALQHETFRFVVLPDGTWTVDWCPKRWKEADETDKWVFVASGGGPRVYKYRTRKGDRNTVVKVEHERHEGEKHDDLQAA